MIGLHSWSTSHTCCVFDAADDAISIELKALDRSLLSSGSQSSILDIARVSDNKLITLKILIIPSPMSEDRTCLKVGIADRVVVLVILGACFIAKCKE